MQLLSPRQVAHAIQVSESSVKRWCDRGDLEAQYTTGGHRRISDQSLLQFLRKRGKKLVHPELLGLPGLQTEPVPDRKSSIEQLATALLEVNETRCREIISELYLTGSSILEILEQVLTPAMYRIGDRWECGEAAVYQERRGCEVAAMLIHDLRRLLPDVPADAPQACGGAVSGDPYRLPSLMIETALKEAGWKAMSLGENIPLQSFENAIDSFQPELVWISLSWIKDDEQFVNEYEEFYENHGHRAAIVLGGQAATPRLLSRLKYFAHCETIARLVELCQTWNSIRPGSDSKHSRELQRDAN